MKKILFYLPFIKIGGIEKVSIEYLNNLLEKGYKIDLIIDFDMGKDGNTFEKAIPDGIKYQYIKNQNISRLIYYFRTLGKKNKLFNFLLYTLIIFFDFYYYHTKVKKIMQVGKYDFSISFYQFLPSYLTNIKSSKHIIWLHGSIEHFFGGIKNLFKKSYEKKLNKYDYIITIADEMKEQLESFYPNLSKNKIRRIYNPFDFENILNKSNDFSEIDEYEKKLLNSKYICTVSRLDENQKDIKTLIYAYKKLYEENKIHHKLYIIGDGPDKKLLEEKLKDFKLDNNILFLGKKINPYIWMKNSDIFILSSKFEGFGLVLVEAMSVGVYVISSNCKTGPKEILQENICGDLFDVGNYEDLADKINYALNNYEYRKTKILKAFKRIEEFQKNIVIEEFEKLMHN